MTRLQAAVTAEVVLWLAASGTADPVRWYVWAKTWLRAGAPA